MRSSGSGPEARAGHAARAGSPAAIADSVAMDPAVQPATTAELDRVRDVRGRVRTRGSPPRSWTTCAISAPRETDIARIREEVGRPLPDGPGGARRRSQGGRRLARGRGLPDAEQQLPLRQVLAPARRRGRGHRGHADGRRRSAADPRGRPRGQPRAGRGHAVACEQRRAGRDRGPHAPDDRRRRGRVLRHRHVDRARRANADGHRLQVVNDTADEADETGSLSLDVQQGAATASEPATVTILDDDGPGDPAKRPWARDGLIAYMHARPGRSRWPSPNRTGRTSSTSTPGPST